MPDDLNLSLWVRGFEESSMLHHFQRLLDAFPFSRLRPGISSLRVYAMEEVEPPLFEESFGESADPETVIGIAREFDNRDCGYIVEGWWELWQFEGKWTLSPSRVTLFSFGPDFLHDEGDHLRIDLGNEALFLPRPELPQSLRATESNIRGVLRLARELETALPLEKKQLWSESGENFAERLDEAL